MRVASLVWATEVLRAWVLVVLGTELVVFIALFSSCDVEKNIKRGIQSALSAAVAMYWHPHMARWGIVAQAVWRGVTQLVMAILPALIHGVCGERDSPSVDGCLPAPWLSCMLITWASLYLVFVPYFVYTVVDGNPPPVQVSVEEDAMWRLPAQPPRTWSAASGLRASPARHTPSVDVAVIHNPLRQQQPRASSSPEASPASTGPPSRGPATRNSQRRSAGRPKSRLQSAARAAVITNAAAKVSARRRGK